MEDIEKVFKLMVEHKIEYYKSKDIEVKRESLKLDAKKKDYDLACKELTAQR